MRDAAQRHLLISDASYRFHPGDMPRSCRGACVWGGRENAVFTHFPSCVIYFTPWCFHLAAASEEISTHKARINTGLLSHLRNCLAAYFFTCCESNCIEHFAQASLQLSPKKWNKKNKIENEIVLNNNGWAVSTLWRLSMAVLGHFFHSFPGPYFF